MNEELLEILSEIEHDRWSRWHRYARSNWSMERVAQWDELAKTPYANLSEETKEKDRAEVRRYFPLLVTDVKEQDKYRSLAEQLAKALTNEKPDHIEYLYVKEFYCDLNIWKKAKEKALSLAREMGVLK
jgi:hypothetical protein